MAALSKTLSVDIDVALAILFLFFTAAGFVSRYFFKKPSQKLPPGPRGWPVVGALPDLLGRLPPHAALAEMAKKYGPIMYLKMGTCGMVVASNVDAARVFLKTLDGKFSDRPPNAAALMTYGPHDMVFAPYGPKWKLMRKLSNLHMLGGRAVEGSSKDRAAELDHMVGAICDASTRGEAVNVPEILTYAIGNIIGQTMLSRRVFVEGGANSNEFKDMVVEMLKSSGKFNVGDVIPAIAWLDLQGIGRSIRRLHKKLDALATEMIEQHASTSHERDGKHDLLDVLMASTENSGEDALDLINIKALLQDFFIAGTDTSSSAIEWALAEMLKNRKILQRAQEEMDRVVGVQRRLRESDIPNLPYLRAICKETFRKHPSTPFVPRMSTEDTQVDGYSIPKGTRLMVNVWAIGRDPNIWEDPLVFNPGRFLTKENENIDPQGNNFALIPFGAGRRICAGMRVAMVLVEYILGTLVHSFDWKLPADVEDELNMDESFGLTLQKLVPLSALAGPRLSPSAYITP